MNPDATRFTWLTYLADRAAQLLVGAAGAACLYAMLRILGVARQAAVCMAAFVALLLGALLAWDYLRRREFYTTLAETLDELEHAHHLSSLVQPPGFLEGRIAYETCDELCRADAADLTAEREAARANREFVELWTHEVKTPIAAAKLTLSHLHGPEAVTLRQDLERIELSCERALYNARANTLSNDYVIRETPLAQLCREACKDLANLLIESHVTPTVRIGDGVTVLTDAAWTKFVVKQALSNSVKYGARTVTFSARERHPGTPEGNTVLEVADDGMGIAAEEVACVFDRGFSGSNGRDEGSSTGMGLYLAAQVCAAMGVHLQIASERGSGTRILLSFPHDRSRMTLPPPA